MSRVDRPCTPTQDVSYRTSDGSRFLELESAQHHEVALWFNKWYDDNKLYGNSAGSRVDATEAMEWLLCNKDKILELYNSLE